MRIKPNAECFGSVSLRFQVQTLDYHGENCSLMQEFLIFLHQHKLLYEKNRVMYCIGIIHVLEFLDLVDRDNHA